MRKLASLTISLSILFCTALVAGAFGASNDDQRQIRRRGPIEQQLTTNDVEVELLDQAFAPNQVRPRPGESSVQLKLKASSALIVDAVNPVARLTEERDWVRTNWKLRVVEVLSLKPGHSFKVGDVLSVDQEGGELLVGKTKVKARQPFARDMEPNGRYLIFIEVNASGIVILGPTQMARIESDGSLQGRMKEKDAFTGRSLTEVKQETRAWNMANGR